MTGILQQIMNTMEQTRSASVLDSVSTIGFAALFVLGVINCVLGYRLLRLVLLLLRAVLLIRELIRLILRSFQGSGKN